MEFNLENIKDYSTEQLIDFENEITELWDRTNTVFSLTDLTEIIRELTIREIDNT